MDKPKGSLFISIGAAGLAVLGGLGVLISPFVIALTSWFGALIRGLNPLLADKLGQETLPAGLDVGRLISGVGIVAGVILLIFSGLQLTCGILTWKRKDRPESSGLPLAMGIVFAICSLALGLSAPGLIQLALSVLLIVGATINRMEKPAQDQQPVPEENADG